MVLALLGPQEKKEAALNFAGGPNNEFSQTYDDNLFKLVDIDNEIIKIKFTEELKKSDDGIIFFFDIKNYQESLDKINQSYYEAVGLFGNDFPFVFAALNGQLRTQEENKDLLSIKRYSEIEQLYRCKIYEITDKGRNIDELFYYIIKKAYHMNKYKFDIAIYPYYSNFEGYHPHLDQIFSYIVSFDNKTVRFIINDPTSSIEFTNQKHLYSKETKAFISFFDINSPGDFDEFKYLIQEARDYFGPEMIICVGAINAELRSSNKKDQLIPKKRYKMLEDQFNCNVFELKSNEKIDKILIFIGEKIFLNENFKKRRKHTKKSRK